MVYLENLSQFFKDHPELYGDDPMIPMCEVLAQVDSLALSGSGDCDPKEDLEGLVKTTKITSGEVLRLLGEDQFKLFSEDLQTPKHQAIFARDFVS